MQMTVSWKFILLLKQFLLNGKGHIDKPGRDRMKQQAVKRDLQVTSYVKLNVHIIRD